MGASSSSVSQSYLRYENDFELVIRATKDLERLLEKHFDAPSGKTVGLHDKISFAEERFGLSSSTVRTMRRLVTIRNQLVHNPEYNELEDRVSFAVSFDNVEQELKRIVLARNPKKATADGSACVLM